MIVGAYNLDLYCETGNPAHRKLGNWTGSMIRLAGVDRAAAIKQARRAGWTINWSDQSCRCPLCRNYSSKQVVATPDIVDKVRETHKEVWDRMAQKEDEMTRYYLEKAWGRKIPAKFP